MSDDKRMVDLRFTADGVSLILPACEDEQTAHHISVRGSLSSVFIFSDGHGYRETKYPDGRVERAAF